MYIFKCILLMSTKAISGALKTTPTDSGLQSLIYMFITCDEKLMRSMESHIFRRLKQFSLQHLEISTYYVNFRFRYVRMNKNPLHVKCYCSLQSETSFLNLHSHIPGKFSTCLKSH